ncbi:MAG: ATP-binding protein [Nakamurella sp.]
MTTFVGRFSELRKLSQALEEVRGGHGSTGRCAFVSGSRAVGKTRLIGEFTQRARAVSLWYAADDRAVDGMHGATVSSRTPEGAAVASFVDHASVSELPQASRFRDILVPDWDTALRLLADALGDGEPSIVVFDNASTLIESDRSFAPAFRRAWQRSLREKPVLLIVVGRDLTPLTDADGGDAVLVPVQPFNPAELGTVLALDPLGALDAHIVTGGHADIAAQWPTGAGTLDALSAMLGRSPSVFEIRGELYLARQLGLSTQPESVLAATGSAQRSRASIGRIAALPPASLDRSLKSLVADGLMVVDRPLSLHVSREARYRLADSYLRFWLQTIAPRREDIARGRMGLVITDMRAHWDTWRRQAMSVLAQEAMNRLATAGQLPGTRAVGSYWNRFEDVRIDLVGTDKADNPGAVTFVGGLKWDATSSFDPFDLASLISVRKQVPGVTESTPLVAVSLGGSTVGDAVAAVLGPNELIAAWQA